MESYQLQVQSLLSQMRNDDNITESLSALNHLLPTSHESSCQLYPFCSDYSSARRFYMSGPYETLLYKLLDLMGNIQVFTAHSKLITVAFTEGRHDAAFEVLSTGLSSKYSSLTNERCLYLVTQLVSFNKLSDVVKKKCADETVMFNGEFDSLIQAIVNLPDRAANRFQRNVPEPLQRDQYYLIVFKAILTGLHAVKSRLELSMPSSVAFVSQLVGKLCLNGHATDLWKHLLANIMMSQDFLISRVFHKVICGIPLKCLDATIIPLLKCVHHHEDLSALLGNTIINTTRLEYLIMDKLFLHKYYTTPDVHLLLYNVVGYLASSPSRVELYQDLAVKLLRVWSDNSSIRHISFDQHMYISKAIVVCAAFMKPLKKADEADIMKIIMSGLQNHLESSNPCMRRVGMSIAQIITPIVQPKIEKKLEFDFDSNVEYETLRSFLKPPSNLPDSYGLTDQPSVNTEGKDGKHTKSPKKKLAKEDLDSDDDLEPMGKFEDKPRPSHRPPAYLGECMQGLMDDEHPDRVESCLKVASKLIRKNKAMVQEISVEFAKILLHMGSTVAIESYMVYRHQSLVSLLVMSPQPVAEYLCAQFKSRNYNVRQRLDILDALAAGAMELSDPNAQHEQKTAKLVKEVKKMDINKTTKPGEAAPSCLPYDFKLSNIHHGDMVIKRSFRKQTVESIEEISRKLVLRNLLFSDAQRLVPAPGPINICQTLMCDINFNLFCAEYERVYPAHCRCSVCVRCMNTTEVPPDCTEPDWKTIVDARVKAKTRRFAKASQSTPQGTANRFANVAGSFFFPLLAAANTYEGEYNPLSADLILLVQYLYTLGKITASSLNSPLVNKIAPEMLALFWVFRSSVEREVRKAAMFCLAMSLMIIPPTDLLSMYDMADNREYLEALSERDPDPDVRDMAGKVVTYLRAQLKVSLDKSLAANKTSKLLGESSSTKFR